MGVYDWLAFGLIALTIIVFLRSRKYQGYRGYQEYQESGEYDDWFFGSYRSLLLRLVPFTAFTIWGSFAPEDKVNVVGEFLGQAYAFVVDGLILACVLVLVAVSAYCLKRSNSKLYGSIEVVFGLVSIFVLACKGGDGSSPIPALLGIVGSFYVVIRGIADYADTVSPVNYGDEFVRLLESFFPYIDWLFKKWRTAFSDSTLPEYNMKLSLSPSPCKQTVQSA